MSVAILYVFTSPDGASPCCCVSCASFSVSSGVAEPPQAASPITIVNVNAIAVADLKNFISSQSPFRYLYFIYQ